MDQGERVEIRLSVCRDSESKGEAEGRRRAEWRFHKFPRMTTRGEQGDKGRLGMMEMGRQF